MTAAVHDAFADLVARLDPAMVVVTVAAGDEVDGCLVGFHSQCSIVPPRYVVWLSRANRTFELAAGATHLAVHVLGADDHDLAARFGGVTGDDVDKLAQCAWAPGPDGVPLLDRCPTRFAGRIVARVDGGDHVGHILDPVDAATEGEPSSLRLAAVTDVEPGHDATERR